jgi:hypothetical protein
MPGGLASPYAEAVPHLRVIEGGLSEANVGKPIIDIRSYLDTQEAYRVGGELLNRKEPYGTSLVEVAMLGMEHQVLRDFAPLGEEVKINKAMLQKGVIYANGLSLRVPLAVNFHRAELFAATEASISPQNTTLEQIGALHNLASQAVYREGSDIPEVFDPVSKLMAEIYYLTDAEIKFENALQTGEKRGGDIDTEMEVHRQILSDPDSSAINVSYGVKYQGGFAPFSHNVHVQNYLGMVYDPGFTVDRLRIDRPVEAMRQIVRNAVRSGDLSNVTSWADGRFRNLHQEVVAATAAAHLVK